MSLKKIGLVATLALTMAASITTVAFAAQVKDAAAVKGDGISDYLATPKNTTNGYPDGIYLQDQDGNGIVDEIHSNYQRNTDACASCHATHTGVGAALLQWATVTATCEACHDGTIAQTYDVENGQIAATGKRTYGGLFMESLAEGTNSLSRHSVGTVNINAAPGGAGAAVTTPDANGSAWGSEFECTSCHTPHGQGGNYRILNPDVNGLAMIGKKTGVAMTTTDTLTYAAPDTNWIMGYPYSKNTKIYVNGVAAASSTYTIDGKNGQVIFKVATPGTVTADYVPAIKVTATLTGKLTAAETVTYGTGFNKFCGACHTDYNTSATMTNGSAGVLTGTYTEAYRHQVGYSYSSGEKPGLKLGTNKEVSCMTCHVAHGTDQGWWTDWKTTSGWAGTVSGENAGSSALKRLPNMSTCEACHAKGLGNYQYN